MARRDVDSQERAAPRAPAEARAEPWTPLWLRRAGALAGALYLAAIWLAAVKPALPERVLPRPVLFFTQVAELFPNAAIDSIEWRARGWRCALGRFDEVDVRPFFPIRQDDKESRFDRAMFFHHRQRPVLVALDRYITSAQNHMRPAERIGGVMLLSLRVPIPPLGETGPRWRWMPLDEYPPSVERRYWYTTSMEARTRRCEEEP
ncbi:MAG TPA: hypothetical protein VG319_11290 [Polyangia bacterium]|nr:hypothetical protein [Polyangia bacterium]